MADAAPEPLDDATGGAVIGVLAILAGEATLSQLDPDVVRHLSDRLGRHGFDPGRPVEEHLDELVSRVRHAIGERPGD